jgi:hypothetical protein
MKTRLLQQLIRYGALAVLSGILMTSFIPTQAQTPSSTESIPQLTACIPDWDGFYQRTKIVSSTRFNQKDYYLLHAYQVGSEDPDNLVISVPATGGTCQQEFLDVGGNEPCLSKVLGNPIGRELTLGLYQRELEALGRDQVQANIEKAAASREQVPWCEETIWSLQQLNFSIPNNVVPR